MTMRRYIATIALAFGLLAVPLMAQEHPEAMHIHDAYARVQGGVGGSGAVYFLIHNNSGSDDRFVAALSEDAAKTSLHSSLEDANGMMTMVEIEGGLDLAAGEMIAFARGGNHVMLMGLTRALNDGDVLTLTLIFDGAGEVTLEVPVDNSRKGDDDAAGHGAMHGNATESGAANE
jgi:periplasmic copper chaperone A